VKPTVPSDSDDIAPVTMTIHHSDIGIVRAPRNCLACGERVSESVCVGHAQTYCARDAVRIGAAGKLLLKRKGQGDAHR
jgi:hypothetical protein